MPSARALLRRSRKQLKAALTPLAQNLGQRRPGIPAEHWGLGRGPDGALRLGDVTLAELCGQYGSPLYVFDAARLMQNVRAYTEQPRGAQRAPEIYYSYKTNPVPGVLRRLHGANVGAEVISAYELWLARRLGVPWDRIVYNGPVKSDESVREAIRGGILLLNINHREELAQISRIAEEEQTKVRLGIRVVPKVGWSGQFGIPIESGEALDAYREAQRHPSLDVVALHAHRGGMMRTREEAAAFLSDVLAFADEVEGALGRPLQILDVGGSLCSRSVASLSGRDVRLNRSFQRPLDPPALDGALTIREYVAQVMTTIEEHYAQHGRKPPRVFLEPGRSMTSDAALLLTSVHTLKAGTDGQPHWAVLDAGQNLAESVRSEFHQVLIARQDNGGAQRSYALAGPICSPGDVLTVACELPQLAPGDVLAIMDAGAYFIPFSTSFSFPRPAIVMLEEGGGQTLLRRAESFDDVVRLDDLPEETSS